MFMNFLAVGAALSAPSDCMPLTGMSTIIERASVHYLLVGEVHGTVEMPQIASAAVCAAAASGRSVVLGLEFPVETQPALDAYLASNGDSAARTALLAAPAWKERGGRTTVAIFDMIEAARRLARSGRPVSVAAIDLVPEPIVSKEREEGLARGLVAARSRAAASLVVALVGSSHADRNGWTDRTPSIATAGQILPMEQTLSLAGARPGGRYWACPRQADGLRVCAAQEMAAREPKLPRAITLDPELRSGFDGVVHPGRRFTASAPAIAR